MTAKEYLSQAPRAEARIAALLERRERCRALAARRGEEEPAALAALGREIDLRIDAYAALVRDIDRSIDRVGSEKLRDVLRYRYLNGWSWRRIADQMHFSQQWLWRMHAQALRELDRRAAERTE